MPRPNFPADPVTGAIGSLKKVFFDASRLALQGAVEKHPPIGVEIGEQFVM